MSIFFTASRLFASLFSIKYSVHVIPITLNLFSPRYPDVHIKVLYVCDFCTYTMYPRNPHWSFARMFHPRQGPDHDGAPREPCRTLLINGRASPLGCVPFLSRASYTAVLCRATVPFSSAPPAGSSPVFRALPQRERSQNNHGQRTRRTSLFRFWSVSLVSNDGCGAKPHLVALFRLFHRL